MKITRLIFSLLILAGLLTGCSAAAKAPAAVPASGLVQSAPGDSYSPPAAPSPVMEKSVEGADYSGSGNSGSPGTPSATERIVINNASLSIVVDNPAESMAFIQKTATEIGGFVVSSNLYKTTIENGLEIPQASIVVRVPADQLTDTIEKIKSLVKNPDDDIRNETISGQDVTQEYTDTKSRLKNLENTRDQLREIMQSAQKTEDVLAVLAQLNQITEQIEVLQGQINFYDTSARYSSISTEILSTAGVKPLSIGGWQPVGVARNAIQALINMFKFLVNVMIWMILFILPLIVVIFIPIRVVWIIIKRWQKKRKAAIKDAVAETPPQPGPPAGKA